MPQEDKKLRSWQLDETLGKLIYFGDPMCSWCWGIAPALEKLRLAFEKDLSFEIVMGGLRPGGGDPWNGQMKSFLRAHWEQVHKASGQKFNFTLLDNDHFNYDTEPSCRAVVIARALKPNAEFDFFKAVQYRFYVENDDPCHERFYKPVCEKLDIPFNQFETLFESEEYAEKVKEDFYKSRNYGIRSFPSVVYQHHNQVSMLTSGFASFENMSNKLDMLLGKKAGKLMS